MGGNNIPDNAGTGVSLVPKYLRVLECSSPSIHPILALRSHIEHIPKLGIPNPRMAQAEVEINGIT